MSPTDPLAAHQALVESTRIRVPSWQGVEYVFEFDGWHWRKLSLQGGKLRRDPEPLMLAHVIADSVLSEEDRRRALRIDPVGAAKLPPGEQPREP